MSTQPHPGLGQWAPIHPSTDRASWTEYQRRRTASVTPAATATVLAAGRPRPDDDRANRRQRAHGTPTTPATRAAHAAAQRRRSSSPQSEPARLSLMGSG